MSKRTASAVLALSLLTVPGIGTVQPAEAATLSLHFGGGFRIGGTFFKIGVHHRDGRYVDHYYRTAENLHYRGHSCNRACFRDGGFTYHHRACPLVQHHFERRGYTPYQVFNAYAPRYEGPAYYQRRGHGHDDHRWYGDRHPRSDRYDHRDRHPRRHRRHDDCRHRH